MAEPAAALVGLVGFARALRRAGVAVTSGQVVAFCRAVAELDPCDRADLYWAGRATLVAQRADLAAYDRVFAAVFDAAVAPPPVRHPAAAPESAPAAETLAALRGEVDNEDEDEHPEEAGAVASNVELLRRKQFSAMTAAEQAALARLVRGFRLAPPEQVTRRSEPARRGPYPDLARTLRRALRTHGEVLDRRWRRRRRRPRRLVLLLDVSGSMAESSRALLAFAHAGVRGSARVEVFCFGTRLTRLTEQLRRRDPDQALAAAAETVLDWDGGTRIGACLRQFNRDWGRQGLARGAVAVICSDGLERGDPELLAAEMARLGRLAARIVWVNPLKGDPAYQPLTQGMRAALPHIDALVPGHNLASLEELAALLPRLR